MIWKIALVSVISLLVIGVESVGVLTRKQIYNATSASNRVFAHELFNAVARYHSNQNIVLSTFVVSSGLSMALLGAKGQTATQLMDTLKYSSSERERNGYRQSHVPKLYKKLCFKLVRKPANESGYNLHIANRIFGEKSETFLPAFVNDTQTYYNAKLKRVSYKTNPKTAAKIINDFVRKETNNKIEEAISPSTLSPETLMTLVSAIYFEGKWKYPFDPKLTHDGIFQRSDGSETTAVFMKTKFLVEIGFSESLRATKVVLPYVNAINQLPVVMELYLPDAYGSTDLEQISSSEFEQVFPPLEKYPIFITLPKFEMEFDIELSSILREMGIRDLFDTNADLSGMNGARNIFFNAAVQKTYIKVDEAGTTAAGVFAVAQFRTSMQEEILFNRPFIYIIREVTTNTVLFMGKVSDPSVQ